MGITQTKSTIQDSLPFQALLGEITVMCRQKPQVTTYNCCQVYTATLLSFFKPFSFSTLNSNTAALGKLNLLKAWCRTLAFCDLTAQFCQDFQKNSIWKFSEGYSKELNSKVSWLILKGAINLHWLQWNEIKPSARQSS